MRRILWIALSAALCSAQQPDARSDEYIGYVKYLAS